LTNPPGGTPKRGAMSRRQCGGQVGEVKGEKKKKTKKKGLAKNRAQFQVCLNTLPSWRGDRRETTK